MLRTRRFKRLLEITRRPARPTAPLVFGLLVALVTIQLAGLLLAVPELSLGQALGLTIDGVAGLELWRIPAFALSCFAPVSTAEPAFVPALLASFLLFAMTSAAIFLAGGAVEARLGTRAMTGMVLAGVVLHGLVSLLVFRLGGAFGPTSIAASILTVAYLARIEAGPRAAGMQADARLAVTAFLIMTVLVSAAFDETFLSPLIGMFAGVLSGFGAFQWVRSWELSRLEAGGTASVGGVLYADDVELLTEPELRASTDELLAKISADGYGSLDQHQRAFLARASARLRQMDSVGSGE